MLEVRLLGQYALTLDGRPLVIASRPARLLFAYTLLNQTPHTREHLAELLWPDSSQANARSNLRHALWRLRTDLADGDGSCAPLVITEHRIGLDLQCPLWLDVDVLEAPIADDAPVEAIEAQLCLYQGELMPGYSDDWIVLERERLKAILALRMDTLLERLAANGNWPAVIAWSEQWITLDDLSETAYRYLMRAHRQLGDVGLAGLAYRRCRQVLAEEFDAEPSAATRSLAATLQHSADAPTSPLSADIIASATRSHAPQAAPLPDDILPAAGDLSREMQQMRHEQARLRRELWLAVAVVGMLLMASHWWSRTVRGGHR